MPYIDQAARAEIAEGRTPKTPGELNFQLTRIVMNDLAERGPLSYTACHGVITSLEALKVEVIVANLPPGVPFCIQRGGEPSALSLKLALVLAEFGKANGAAWSLADVLGTIECVKLEFYRRVVAPYEDQKCEQNGDAYHPFYVVK